MNQAAQLIEQALGDTAFAGDAHDFLMAVYKDTSHRLGFASNPRSIKAMVER